MVAARLTKPNKTITLTFSALLLLSSCSTVPLTGRSQLNLIGSSRMQSMANKQYDQVLKKEKVVTNTESSQRIKQVGHDIKRAVQEYMRKRGQSHLLNNYDWKFNLLKNDEMVNAWAMPGGKVAFYTGILPICEDKNGIAVVMGHEVAHVIARHGNERMSQGLVQKLGGTALSAALSSQPQQTQQLFMSAYGVGSQVGFMLPFSRSHESEADHMGLIFMAMAGYDPREAPKLWKRMAARADGQSPPEFLSTHPSHKTRIAELNQWMPEAMKYYRPKADPNGN